MRLSVIICSCMLFTGMQVPARETSVTRESVIYKVIDGTELRADVYRSALFDGQPDKPAIAFFHGGGWAYGYPGEFAGACERYAAKGFVCFSFQYRLSVTAQGRVPHPDITLVECVRDARSAMRWVREHAQEYGIDPGRIIACGQSAGGQLALGTALFDQVNEATDNLEISPVPNAFILYSSNVNTLEAWADHIMGDRRQEIWSVSPYHNLKPGLPPAIAFHGTADRMVPYGVVLRFRNKTAELGNHFELVTYEGRRHYLGDEDQEKKVYYNEEILALTDGFLEKFGFLEPVTKEHSRFEYRHTLEQLHEEFSGPLMQMAQADLAALEQTNRDGVYKATLESIGRHPTPEWYQDAKLGLFYDWGPYSIAGYGTKGWNRARYPDWYLNHMYHAHKDYHRQQWGADFERDDFIALFTAGHFDALQVVEMVKMSGARYIVPFSKHHDGFCLWDSRYTQRDAVDMNPHRDLSAELAEACRKEGVYHGFYFSVEEYEYPVIDDQGGLAVRYWSEGTAPDDALRVDETGEIIGAFVPEKHNRMLSGKIPVRDFIDDLIVPQAKDFLDRYDPDILWFDGEWQRPAEYYRTPDIVAYFYNRSEGRREVVANDRLGIGTREHHGDFYTSETDEVVDKMDEPWEENRSMSESYGYNHLDSLENYLTAAGLVHMLVRIVAKGGNLNLMVNPDGTGRVPGIQLELLRELGDWLKVNGEAIYGTRPYEVICDNTQLGQPVWYTMSKDSTYAYAIIFDWPRSETFICPGASPVWDTEIYMLGYDQPLEWVDTGRDLWGVSAKIPEVMLGEKADRPCRHAWVLRFRYEN